MRKLLTIMNFHTTSVLALKRSMFIFVDLFWFIYSAVHKKQISATEFRFQMSCGATPPLYMDVICDPNTQWNNVHLLDILSPWHLTKKDVCASEICCRNHSRDHTFSCYEMKTRRRHVLFFWKKQIHFKSCSTIKPNNWFASGICLQREFILGHLHSK